MKTLAAAIFLITGMTAQASAEQAKPKSQHVKMTISYKGVDAKWFSEISGGYTRTKSGTVIFPSLTAAVGKQETLEMIREYRIKKGSIEVPCGLTVDLKPEIDGGGIRISGRSVLRCATNKSPKGGAMQFKAQEILIDLKLENGTTKAVAIEGGGQMMITANFLDSRGFSIKE